MAVSTQSCDNGKTRKISFNYIKESFARRSTRQNRPRSHVFCCENGDPKESAVKCPNSSGVDKCEKCVRSGSTVNDKHRVGIFKNLKKRFLFTGNLTRPLKCKAKSVKVLDSACNTFSVSKAEGDNNAFISTCTPKTKQIPPPLLFVRNDCTSDLTSYSTCLNSSSLRTSENRLTCNTNLSLPDKTNLDDRPPVAPRKDIARSVSCNKKGLNEPVYEVSSDEKYLECSSNSDSGELCSVENTPTSSPTIRSLTFELFQLSKYGWYWGPITREEAEEKLFDLPDGAFLVRDSSADRYLLSVSFRSSGKTFHARIEYSHGLFSFYSPTGQEGFASIVELINHSMSFSESAVFCYSRPRAPGHPAFPVRLVRPVSRFNQVRSLQYLCRFVIRMYVRVDNIQKLPLPSKLKSYIQEGHY